MRHPWQLAVGLLAAATTFGGCSSNSDTDAGTSTGASADSGPHGGGGQDAGQDVGQDVGPCALVAANWSTANAAVDELVELVASASGDCSEATVSFRIREDYGTWVVDLGPIPIVDGEARAQWPARWEADPLGYDAYLFEAWLDGDTGSAVPSDQMATDASSRGVCGNEIDDDGDGLVDGQDPGCADAADGDEGDEAATHNSGRPSLARDRAETDHRRHLRCVCAPHPLHRARGSQRHHRDRPTPLTSRAPPQPDEL